MCAKFGHVNSNIYLLRLAWWGGVLTYLSKLTANAPATLWVFIANRLLLRLCECFTCVETLLPSFMIIGYWWGGVEFCANG